MNECFTYLSTRLWTAGNNWRVSQTKTTRWRTCAASLAWWKHGGGWPAHKQVASISGALKQNKTNKLCVITIFVEIENKIPAQSLQISDRVVVPTLPVNCQRPDACSWWGGPTGFAESHNQGSIRHSIDKSIIHAGESVENGSFRQFV